MNKSCLGPYTIQSFSLSEDYVDHTKSRQVAVIENCQTTPFLPCDDAVLLHEELLCDNECAIRWYDCPSQTGRTYEIIPTGCGVLITSFENGLLTINGCNAQNYGSEFFCFGYTYNQNGKYPSSECLTSFTFDGHKFTVSGKSSDIDIYHCEGECEELQAFGLTLPQEIPPLDSNDVQELTESSSIQHENRTIWYNKPEGDQDTGLDVSCNPGENIPRNDVCTSQNCPAIAMLKTGQCVLAYEDRDNKGLTKISLFVFQASVKNSIKYHRSLSMGRLINEPQSTNGKFEFYDDILIETQNEVPEETIYIGFTTGPLKGGTPFLITKVKREIVNERVKNLVTFSLSGKTINFETSNNVSNVEWFIIKSTDELPISNLTLPPHLGKDGKPVTMANPSIAVAENNLGLNSDQIVYLTYQAFDQGKWGVYIRHLILSDKSYEPPVYNYPFLFETANQSSVLVTNSFLSVNYQIISIQSFGNRLCALFEVRLLYNNEHLHSTMEEQSDFTEQGNQEYDLSKVYVEATFDSIQCDISNSPSWTVGSTFIGSIPPVASELGFNGDEECIVIDTYPQTNSWYYHKKNCLQIKLYDEPICPSPYISIDFVPEDLYNLKINDNIITRVIYNLYAGSPTATAGAEIDFMIILDHSGSMSDKIASLQSSLILFVEKLSQFDIKLGLCVYGRGPGDSLHGEWSPVNPVQCCTNEIFDGLDYPGSPSVNGFTSNIGAFILGLQNWGTKTALASGFSAVQLSLEDPRWGWRPDSKKFILLVTDANPLECQGVTCNGYQNNVDEAISVCNSKNCQVILMINPVMEGYFSLSTETGWSGDIYSIYDPDSFVSSLSGISEQIIRDNLLKLTVVERDEEGNEPTFLNKAKILVTYDQDLSDIWTQEKNKLIFTDEAPIENDNYSGLSEFPYPVYPDKIYNANPVQIIGNLNKWYYFNDFGEISSEFPNVGVPRNSIGNPILLQENAIKPKVKVNNRNEVFVVYESLDSGYQISIKGTGDFAQQSIIGAKSSRITKALSEKCFIFSHQVTSLYDKMNQLCDIVIDRNDVVHLTWQSNRDGYWEIYYANGVNMFDPVRITKSESRTGFPKIDIDYNGSIFIVYHDNRFGPYDIMLSFKDEKRIIPLLQQDPYLESLASGYTHYTNTIPIIVTNRESSIKPGMLVATKIAEISGNNENYIFGINNGNPNSSGGDSGEFAISSIACSPEGFFYGVTKNPTYGYYTLIKISEPNDELETVQIDINDIEEIGILNLEDNETLMDMTHDYNGRLWSVVANNTSSQNGTWSFISQFDHGISDFTIYNNELVAAGSFTKINDIDFLRIARWNGSNWSSIGTTGANGSVFSVMGHNNELYAGGGFTSIGGISVNYIAKWNGTSWSTLGTGISGGPNPRIYKIIIFNGEIIVGGDFSSAGSLSANNIAKWNGTSWQSMGSGLNGIVFDIIVYNGNIIACGDFTLSGSTVVNRIAKWNGTSWESLGTGTNGQITSMVLHNGELIVGGSFTSAGGNPASRVAKWNGTSWQPMGSGFISFVSSLYVYNNDLYAGGGSGFIYRWNGTQWNLIGQATGNVAGIIGYQGNIIIGGLFNYVDGLLSPKISQFNLANASIKIIQIDKTDASIITESVIMSVSDFPKCAISSKRDGTFWFSVYSNSVEILKSDYPSTSSTSAVFSFIKVIDNPTISNDLFIPQAFATDENDILYALDEFKVATIDENGVATFQFDINSSDPPFPMEEISGFAYHFSGSEQIDAVSGYFNVYIEFYNNFQLEGSPSVVIDSRNNLDAFISTDFIEDAYKFGTEGIFLYPGQSKIITFDASLSRPDTDLLSHPFGFDTNQTYFPKVFLVKPNGEINTKPIIQSVSFSCHKCSLINQNNPDEHACSFSFVVENSSSSSRFYNFRVDFFADEEMKSIIKRFYLIPNHADLQYVEVDNLESSNKWTPFGLNINSSSFIQIYPMLGNTGMICGVKYYVKVEYCSYEEEISCGEFKSGDEVNYISNIFYCSCHSTIHENPIIHISSIGRWYSSGQGFSDTRVTDTVGDSLKPDIKTRRTGGSIILFEDYTLETRGTTLGASFHKTNINETYGSGTKSWFDYNLNAIGKNVQIETDIYDRSVLSYESQDIVAGRGVSNSEIKGNSILFKTCDFDTVTTETPQNCDFKELENTIVSKDEFINKDLIEKIIVHRDYVNYYTYNSNGNLVSVVSGCDVKLQILARPEVIAVRLKNENETSYKEWCAISPEINQYFFEKPWKLSAGRGLKEVCVQVMTYAGVSASFCHSIILDYQKPPFIINIYSDEEYSVLLPVHDGLFVAATKFDEQGIAKSHEYIYVEIIPGNNINNEIINYDVIQQGINNQYNLTASKTTNSKGKTVFRGYFIINVEDKVFNIDGLSRIVVRMPGDCDRINPITSDFNPDRFNIISQNVLIDDGGDLEKYMQPETGRFGTGITIRPDYDPYLIFGNPDQFFVFNPELSTTPFIEEPEDLNIEIPESTDPPDDLEEPESTETPFIHPCGAGRPGGTCQFSTGSPIDDWDAPSSQLSESEDTTWAFITAAAEHFILGMPGDESQCRITQIQAHFSVIRRIDDTMDSPLNVWQSVFVTLYADNLGTPDGSPLYFPPGSHQGTVIGTQEVPVSLLTQSGPTGSCSLIYEVNIPVNFLISKGTRYWISIVARHPTNSITRTQSYWLFSNTEEVQGSSCPSKQFYSGAWFVVEGNAGPTSPNPCPHSPPRRSKRKLAFTITATGV